MEYAAEQSPLDKIAAHALGYVRAGHTLGLGTGRAASAFIRALGESGIRVKGVPTSRASEDLAHKYPSIEPVTLGDVKRIDIDFDGADEVDPRLNLIKGYGGALVREKVVAAASRRVVILVGPDKLVRRLGARGRLPVEVVPFARDFVVQRVRLLGLKPDHRRNGDGSQFLSDNGNVILDCGVREIANPARLERELLAIPGVVGTGLFIGMTEMVLVAPQGDDSVRVMRRNR